MDLLRSHQLNIMLVLAGICSSLMIFIGITKVYSTKRKIILVLMQFSTALILIFDRYAYIFRGGAGELSYWMVRISNFIVFFNTPITHFFFYKYIEDLILNEGKQDRVPRVIYISQFLCLISALLVVISQMTGMYYTFDDNNCYQRGDYFIVCYMLPILVSILGIYVLIQKRGILSKGITVSLWVFLFAPPVGALLQLFYYGISFINIIIAATAICLYIFLLIDTNKNIDRLQIIEKELLIEQRLHAEENVAAISDVFHIMYEVDIANDTFKEIKSLEQLRPYINQYESAKACLRSLPKLMFHEEDQVDMEYIYNIDNWSNELLKNNHFSKDARGNWAGWLQTNLFVAERNETGEPLRVIVALENIDDEKKKQLELDEINRKQQQQIEENLRQIEIAKQKQSLVDQAIATLAYTIDAKDSYTRGHSVRVAKYSQMIAERSGFGPEECHEIYLTGLLHDIGKISILDSVINKPGKLTDEEFAQIKEHTNNGVKILERMENTPFLSEGAKYHHERYDGKGYPCGLKGENIPERARIIAVADAYDAMTSNRSYRGVMDQSLVRQEIWKGVGTQFDPYFAKIMISFIDSDVNYDMREKKHMQDEILITAIPEGEKDESSILALRDECIRLQSTDIKYFGTFIKTTDYWATPENRVQILNSPITFSFVSKTDDTANRIWQSACLIFYSADDGEVDGKEYTELSVVKSTGYGWNVYPAIDDQETITRKDTFTTWDDWMADCKKGMTHNISVYRDGNIINAIIDNIYLSVEIKVILPEDYKKDVYVAVTGDRCIIEDFQIKKNP